jgi:hypothetical protein
MRVILMITSILFTLTSCRNQQSKGNALEDFTPEPLENFYKKGFDEAFFREAHYNYAPDSTKHNYSAETIVSSDTAKHFLRTCNAKLVGDSLLLKLTDTPFSKNGYDLRILKLLNGDERTYYKLFTVGDTIHQVPLYTILSKSHLMDKTDYSKGDELRAKIALIALVHSGKESVEEKDTIRIYGLIKTKIE